MAESVDISSNYAITLFAPDKLATLMKDDPLIGLCPPSGTDFNTVQWEQPENGYGLLSLRGLNGDPAVTSVPGFRRLSMTPGYYGEQVVITEYEMDREREYGTPNEPMDMSKRIGYIQEQVLKRAFDRMRYIISALFRTGRFFVTAVGTQSGTVNNGSLVHADTLDGYASNNVFTPAVNWQTQPTIATPINDLQSWRNTLQLSTDAWFDNRSTLLMNSPSLTSLLNTTQIQSQMRIGPNNNTVAGLKMLNELLEAYNLPKIEVYDENYYETKADAAARTNAQYFMPSYTAIWKAVRKDGVIPAQFQFTRNAALNPPAGVAQNAPGYQWTPNSNALPMANEIRQNLYTIIRYNLMPPKYLIDIGFNGGPAVPYATAFAGINWQ